MKIIQFFLLALFTAFGFCSCAGDGSSVRFVPSGGYHQPVYRQAPQRRIVHAQPNFVQPRLYAAPQQEFFGNNGGGYVRRQPAPNFYNGGGGNYGRRSYYDENGARPDGYNPRYGGAVQSRIDPRNPFAPPFYVPYQPMR